MSSFNRYDRPRPQARYLDQSGSGRVKLLLGFFFLVVVFLVALRGWSEIYSRYLERNPPVILFDEAQPRGIGISPVTVSFSVTDKDTGLDEVVVRVHQRNVSKEVFRKSYSGEHRAEIPLVFPGEKSGLEEGIVQLEIKAFDKSFWSNSEVKTLELRVDYRKPKIEPVTVMHNTRRGGTQVVFYRALDQNLSFSGVKVGSQTFLGFPARGIDKDIDDNNIFVALYGIDMFQNKDDKEEPQVRLFAQDWVGNASSGTFPNRILPRPERTQVINLTDDFLLNTVSDLADHNLGRIQSYASELGKKVDYTTSAGSQERLVEKFRLLNDYLRVVNEQELVGLLKKGGKFERYWTGPFLQESGSITSSFGDTIAYKYNNQVVSTAPQTGFDIAMPKSGSEVIAVADGVVIFQTSLGVYGRIIGIDHGLGLVSIYAHLDTILVKEGDTVTAGQPIGTGGKTGLARNNEVHFELRLQGVPVDPREWWDRSWYYGHVTDQITTAKKLLEIPVSK